mgnify:CR=1 FL=1
MEVDKALRWMIKHNLQNPTHPKTYADVARKLKRRYTVEQIKERDDFLKEVVVEGFDVKIKKWDLHSTIGLNWLNDEVINFYRELLLERENASPQNIYIHNTFFMTKLLQGGYDHNNVKKWLKRKNVDLFSLRLLLIPMNLNGGHWTLATIDVPNGTITYYDSMGGSEDEALENLKRYVADEHLAHKKKPLPEEYKIRIVNTGRNVPQQNNCSDCGVFMCQFMNYLATNDAFNFGQRDMPHLRLKMVLEILNKRLFDFPDAALTGGRGDKHKSKKQLEEKKKRKQLEESGEKALEVKKPEEKKKRDEKKKPALLEEKKPEEKKAPAAPSSAQYVWPMQQIDGKLDDATDSDAADYLLHDVRGNGNCFHYAFLRASKAKNIEPGKSKLPEEFDPTKKVLLKSGKIKPHDTSMRALKKDFKKLFENEKVTQCKAFQDMFSLVDINRKQFERNLTKNKEQIEYTPGLHDALFQCLYNVKLRVYYESVGWVGSFADANPHAADVINLFYEPETKETSGHYMWLEPLQGKLSGGVKDVQLKNLGFDAAWFGSIATTTLANHRKRLEVLATAMPDADLVKDIDRIVAFVEKRYQAPFNVYSTLRKVLRQLAPHSSAYELIRSKPTGYTKKQPKLLQRKKNANEKKLWMEWPTIDRSTAKLYKKVKEGNGTDEDLEDLLRLGLYVYNDPRRNDYHNMKMGRGSDKSINFCDLKRRMFVFNEYKTAKFYNTQEIPISDRLVKIIRWHQKRFKYEYLVAPTALTTSQFTDRMKATTKRRLGKEIGSRMLRKIFLTFKLEDPIKKMMVRARKMGHNFSESLQYIRV